jgi:hypothetical protein
MLKQPEPTLHKTTHGEITSLFGGTKLILDETPKAISPFGGLASFISFLGQIGLARQIQQHLPFAEPVSNNAIPLAHSLTSGKARRRWGASSSMCRATPSGSG